MISAYEYTYTYITLHYDEDSFLKREYLSVFRPMVPLAATIASIARGLIEGYHSSCVLRVCAYLWDLLTPL